MYVNKKIKNATACTVNGVNFRSKQEASIYKYLLSVGITPEYESKRYTIWDRECLKVPYYDRYGKMFQKITRKPTAVHYTPDFTFEYKGYEVIMEVKGFKNDAAPYKIRLFREYLEEFLLKKPRPCYAVVYSISDVKQLLTDLEKNELK